MGPFRFPDRGPGAQRVLGNGRALREAGYRVTFVGSEFGGRAEDLRPDGRYFYSGFEYLPLPARSGSLARRLYDFWDTHSSGNSIIRRMRGLGVSAASAIIAYDCSSLLLSRLLRWTRRVGVPLVADTVEWFDPCQLLMGRWGPFRWDSELRVHRYHPRCTAVIAISQYLERHYSAQGCRVLRVPPLVDVQDEKWPTCQSAGERSDVLRLAYAGVPGKKDLIWTALRAWGLLPEGDRARVRFRLIGPRPAEVEAALAGDGDLRRRLGSQVEVTGPLPHREALVELARADFSVMLRPAARFCQAGFPTKLVESLACGVPMLGNLTSDIGLYVRDGIEGIIVPAATPEAFAAGMQCALALSRDERAGLGLAARARARASFDFRNYIGPMGRFLGETRAGCGAGERRGRLSRRVPEAG